MELVEGEDLSQRIARGALPLDEAVPIARQIAEALDAAHERGLYTASLKPANIKVRAGRRGEGAGFRFGQARAAGVGSEPQDVLTASPTITSPARMTGIGRDPRHRGLHESRTGEGPRRPIGAATLGAGAVLYEMLTGRRAFDGEDIAEVLGAVVCL